MAEILFRPICSKCHQVIYEKIDCEPISIHAGGAKIMAPEYFIDPNKCPYCDSIFTRIEMPTKLPFEENQLFIMRKKCYSDWYCTDGVRKE